MECLEIIDCIDEGIENKRPFIYLKKQTEVRTVLDFDQIQGIVCDLGDKYILESGYPHELICPVDLSIHTPKFLFKPDGPIVYFSAKSYDTEIHVLEIVKLFNSIPSRNTTIYLSSNIFNKIKHFANDNINFNLYENSTALSVSASVIITHGYLARSVIRQKVPLVILGPYGLGGWITPENIKYLLKHNFSGRPGGNYEEVLPLEVFIDELVEINNCIHIQALLEENHKLQKQFLSKFPKTTIEEIIERLNSTFLRIQNTYERNSLRTYLTSNINIIENKGYLYAQRYVFKDLVFSLPINERKLITDLSFGLTCQELQKKHDMESEELWELLKYLYTKKVIYFK